MCILIIAVAHNGLPTFNFDNLFLQFCMLNFIIYKIVRRLSNVCLFVCLFFEVFKEEQEYNGAQVNLATNDRLPVHHVPFPVYPGLHVQ